MKAESSTTHQVKSATVFHLSLLCTPNVKETPMNTNNVIQFPKPKAKPKKVMGVTVLFDGNHSPVLIGVEIEVSNLFNTSHKEVYEAINEGLDGELQDDYNADTFIRSYQHARDHYFHNS